MPAKAKTRNVSLTLEIGAFIDDRVASGGFRSASEVVRAALLLLQEDELRREARKRRHLDDGVPSSARSIR
jgi:antitoxin ParD1/3/4